MAKNTTTLSYRVTFEGKQAKDYVLDLKKQMADLGQEIADVKKEIAGLEKTGQDTTAKKIQLSGLEDSLKTVSKLYKKTVTEIKGYNDVLKNLTNASYNDLSRTATAITRSLKAEQEGTKKYIKLLEQLRRVKEEMGSRTQSFTDFDRSQATITKMTLAMKDMATMSDEALESQKKYWKELAKGAEEGSRQQFRFKTNLQEIIYEEHRRAEFSRQQVLYDPMSASIEELKEAIKYTEQLRNTEPINSDEYKRYNEELSNLKDTLKQTEKPMKKVALSADEMDQVLGNLRAQPLEQLEKAAEQLKDELRSLPPTTEDYIKASQELRRVNEAMENIKEDWSEHESQITQTVKRLKSYVLVYAGWNFISGKVKGFISENLKLSDSLADIRKTTELAGESLNFLSREIDRIDTRTSQEQLHQLAATAGQMGINSSTEVLGFVKASNQLNVALNELGEDGVLSLAKIAQLTGDISTMGVEKSLLAIGSSINELSANSAAAAEPIADFMRRVGGLAPLANLSTSNLAALGATADALGQPIEVAATAMNKFIMSLVTNTDEIAYALNLDASAMKNLIDSGRTIEAIVMVLEKLRSSGKESGAELNAIFKELGGEGARLVQVISSMAQNTSFLKEQVDLSAKAFHEATSATKEYNVKNENAAAIAERIGNMFREYFVNADYTSTITKLLKIVMEFVKTLGSLSNTGVALRAVLWGVFVQLIAVGSGLNKMLKQLFITRTGVVSLTRAWHGFTLALKNNAFGLVLGLLTTVVLLVKNWGAEQRKLTEHINELNSSLGREKRALDAVRDSLQEVKDDTEKREELVSKINRDYGNYLDNLLDEAAGYEEIARALDLVNQKLELKYAQMIFNKRIEKAQEQYEGKTEKSSEALLTALSKIPGIGDNALSVYQDLLVVMKKLASEASDAGYFDNTISDNWEEFAKLLPKYLYEKEFDIRYFLQELYEEEVEYNKAIRKARAEQNANVIAETEDVAEAQAALVEAQRKRMEELMAMSTEGMTEEEMYDHYKKIIEYGELLMADAKKRFNEEKVALDAQGIFKKTRRSTEENPIEAPKNEIKELEEKLAPFIKKFEGDAWNKALNIPGLQEAYGNLKNINTASVDNLVKTYQSLEDAGKKYTSVEVFNAIFNQDAKNIDEMLAYYKESAAKVKARLAELGYTTAGNFDWSTEQGRNAAKKKANEEFEAAKSALKAHFEEQERIVKQSYLNREITYEEMQRRISKNEENQAKAFVDFYAVLLKEGDDRYNTDLASILKGKDLQKLGEFLRRFGASMTDGLVLGLEQNENEIRTQLINTRRIIEEALLGDDTFGKLKNKFRVMLDELSLLSTDWGETFIATDEATAGKLVNQMTKMASKAYTLTKQDLLDDSADDTDLTEFWTGVSDDQLKLILEKLRNYYDSMLDLQRRYAQQMQREWKQLYKQTGGEAAYEANKQAIEGMDLEQSIKQGFGGRRSYNADRGSILAKAALEGSKLEDEITEYQKRLSTLKAGSAEYESMQALIAEKTVELNAIIQQSEIDTTMVTVEQWQKRAEAASEWTEMIGESFTEVAILQNRANKARIAGDEEAAKELEQQAEESRQNAVKAALNKTIDLAKVWAMELGIKLMYNALAQKSDEQTAAAGTQATLKSVLADIIANGFKGAGKEVGSKGVAGLVTGALIIAAAAGLAAAAKAAVANMYPEGAEGVSDADVSSSKRKLTTGMLTYAEGKYPVLGNDGVVYDAKYAGSGMKTGVYSGPHYGIFSEKKPEMVIDGDTTRRLVVDYPMLYESILTLSRTGHLGMRTYADGNMAEFGAVGASAAQQQAQMEMIQQTLAATASAVAALNRRLEEPINATINRYGRGGSMESERKAQNWERRNRV